VHPDLLDPELDALAHRLVGGLGSCSDHDRVDTAGDRLQVVIRPVALDLVGVRVDGEDLVASLAQAPVDDVAAVVSRRSRYSGDGHAPVTEEFRRGILDRCR
jgi:hypothetical protein